MAKKEKGPSLETGMLAFARSLQISEGLFYAHGDGGDKIPVEVVTKGVLGQSSESNTKNPGQLNLQNVEHCTVPPLCDRVTLEFSLRALPHSLKPHACGDPEVGQLYQQLATNYRDAGGYQVLADRYAWNIANGRFAWRNRFQSDAMQVQVRFEGIEVSFDPTKANLDTFDGIDQLEAAIIAGGIDDVRNLAKGIARGLSGQGAPFAAHVTWSAEMEQGQEVFPSQEILPQDELAKRKDKRMATKVLAKLRTQHGDRKINQASMHSQKIGAALRHLDTWHGKDGHGAVTVNPYAGVKDTSDVLRPPKEKNDFYSIRKNVDALLEGATSLSDEAHFFMANLVRGGVFGKSDKE